MIDAAESSIDIQSYLMKDDLSGNFLAVKLADAADRGVVGFLNEQGDFLPKWWKLRHPDPATQISVSQTIVHRVAKQQEAVLVENTEAPR